MQLQEAIEKAEKLEKEVKAHRREVYKLQLSHEGEIREIKEQHSLAQYDIIKEKDNKAKKILLSLEANYAIEAVVQKAEYEQEISSVKSYYEKQSNAYRADLKLV